jgi:hypothetical protein
MGERDSSRTRAAPIVTHLWALQGRRPSWLIDLLKLPEINEEHPGARLGPQGSVRRYGLGAGQGGVSRRVRTSSPTKQLSAMIGHASIQLTYDTYGHLMPDAFDGFGGALDSLLPEEAEQSLGDRRGHGGVTQANLLDLAEAEA